MSKAAIKLDNLIGRKWFLGIEKLAKESKVSMKIIARALRGEKIVDWAEKRLRTFLENL